MKRLLTTAAALLVCLMLVAAGMEAAQRGWVLPLKASGSIGPAPRLGFLRASPRATVGSDANGVYCTSPSDNGVGIHDIGAIPNGLHVVITVESYSDGFDPVAAVVAPTLGQKASNNVHITTFYDNNSGGGSDSKIDFVTPQAGNYILLVGDYPDTVVGCYRYQVRID